MEKLLLEIKTRRKALNIKQTELAQKLGIKYFGVIETGRSKLTADKLLILAHILEIDLNAVVKSIFEKGEKSCI